MSSDSMHGSPRRSRHCDQPAFALAGVGSCWNRKGLSGTESASSVELKLFRYWTWQVLSSSFLR